jgi:hypothetical protein
METSHNVRTLSKTSLKLWFLHRRDLCGSRQTTYSLRHRGRLLWSNTLRPSRSPSAIAESLPATEDQEWPLHGFLKRTRIGKETTYNLEFHLTHLPDDLELSTPFAALGSSFSVETSTRPRISHSTVTHFRTHHVPSGSPMKRVRWIAEEDATLVRMRENGCSWEEISAALPSRNPGAIQVRYSTKFSNGRTGSRKHRRS